MALPKEQSGREDLSSSLVMYGSLLVAAAASGLWPLSLLALLELVFVLWIRPLQKDEENWP
jgi:hypothetical protein